MLVAVHPCGHARPRTGVLQGCRAPGRTCPVPDQPRAHRVPLRAHEADDDTRTIRSTSPPLDVWLRQQLAEAENRRRMNALAERDARREREDRWRRQQQEQDAYQAARQQTLQDQRSRSGNGNWPIVNNRANGSRIRGSEARSRRRGGNKPRSLSTPSWSRTSGHDRTPSPCR